MIDCNLLTKPLFIFYTNGSKLYFNILLFFIYFIYYMINKLIHTFVVQSLYFFTRSFIFTGKKKSSF